MEVTTNEPTTCKVARIEDTVIEVTTIEDAMLKRDILKSLFLCIQPNINLECVSMAFTFNAFSDVEISDNLPITL
ncbi:hypothetical protein D3C72_2030270 [compost metagenome]